jgi:hypothetical protein
MIETRGQRYVLITFVYDNIIDTSLPGNSTTHLLDGYIFYIIDGA